MLYSKFQVYQPFDSREEDFERFFIWAWWPSWSCDINHLYPLSFFHPMKAPHEIWLQLTWFFEEKILNLSDLRQRSMNDLDL